MKCGICGSTAGKYHGASEMMFGTREKFAYFECAVCGCLQLVSPPARMERHYPAEYYSFAAARSADVNQANRWRGCVARIRNQGQIFGWPWYSKLLAKIRANPGVEWSRELLKGTELRSLRARILDVGCGSGHLLYDLRDVGFRSLTGADPYLNCGSGGNNGVCLLAKTLEQLGDCRFDLIMLHHSLEHMDNQLGVFQQISDHLAPGGACIIRIPLVDSDPWRRYGVDWVELDAPRHFYLHTRRSVEILAHNVGLRCTDLSYDSEAFAYWGSELYRRGLSLHDFQQGGLRDPDSVFIRSEMDSFAAMAARANCAREGGRGRFVLRGN